MAGTDRPYGVQDPRVAYASEISDLVRLTEEALQDPGLADTPTTYVHLLAALLSFEGADAWGEWLDGLNDEEYEVSCPTCSTENFVAFGAHGFFSTTDSMYMKATTARKVPLQPQAPSALAGLGRRLHNRALADGRSGVAHKLTYVFGNAQCAECDVVFSVAEAVVARRG